MEQAAKAAGTMMQTLMMGMGSLSKAFYEKYGEEALPVISGVMSRGGEQSGKLMQQMMPIKDMNAIAESFKMMGAMMGLGLEVVDSSGDAVHIRVSRCPLGADNTNMGLCEALMTHDASMVGSALGQKVDMKITKSIAVGDKACEIIFSISK